MYKKLREIINRTKRDLTKNNKLSNRFYQAILNPTLKKVSIIGEIKLASPSEGKLGNEKDIFIKIKQYTQSGVEAISVVTEKHFFKGNPNLIKKIKDIISLPILQKDFVINEYQIYEAKIYEADALLLIAKILTEKQLINYVNLAKNLGVEPVVEINSPSDLKKALKTTTRIIAVNSRNLDTFKVDINKACKLLEQIPDKYLKLGFSGIKDINQLTQYENSGAKGVLIGTTLMKTKNIPQLINTLRNNTNVQVKICATRSLEASEVALKNGAEFLGLVFTPKVKNHTVDMKVAKEISKKMKGRINLVGVFQNMPLKKVKKIIVDCNLDYGQFHGDESPEYLEGINIKKIKAFRFPGEFNIDNARKQMKKFKVDYYLLDRIKQSEGPILNLNLAAQLAKEFPLIFAGGLSPQNVPDIIKKVKPKMVDVASGVETNGKQDMRKIKEFIKNSKGVTL